MRRGTGQQADKWAGGGACRGKEAGIRDAAGGLPLLRHGSHYVRHRVTVVGIGQVLGCKA